MQEIIIRVAKYNAHEGMTKRVDRLVVEFAHPCLAAVEAALGKELRAKLRVLVSADGRQTIQLVSSAFGHVFSEKRTESGHKFYQWATTDDSDDQISQIKVPFRVTPINAVLFLRDGEPGSLTAVLPRDETRVPPKQVSRGPGKSKKVPVVYGNVAPGDVAQASDGKTYYFPLPVTSRLPPQEALLELDGKTYLGTLPAPLVERLIRDYGLTSA